MKYARLGSTGLQVSRLCLGCMSFGDPTRERAWALPEPEARPVIAAALDHGINFFDTANVYGWEMGKGVTEQIIGRWFEQGDGRRQKVVLATKLYGSMSEWPNDTFLSARNIRLACDASLKRLKTDWIDLYQMHHVDRVTPWEEIWEAFDVLRNQGKVLYFGSSNFAGWHLAQAQEAAGRLGVLGLASEQSIYNLATRAIELEVLPAAKKYGIGVIPWSPLFGGVLAGILHKKDEGRAVGERTQERLAEHRTQVEEYEAFCSDLGEQPADVGLSWLLAQPGVTAPIIGPRTVDQLDSSLRALEVTLDEEALTRLDEIWPGPGGTAPEAYAW
jgi:aryl-alcohol dehydrogenase-like predicted oxidoreductase